ncbi:MAG: hypothetical protein MK207_06275 [Saprospiraceae bacterium]|nr:hypothetical protein [Saprospiraceae bacterium]
MKLNVFATIILTTTLTISLLGQRHHKTLKFKSVIEFDSKHYFGQNDNGSWGFYLGNSTEIIDSEYDTLYPLHKIEFNPKTFLSKEIKTNFILGRSGKKYSLFNLKGHKITTVDGIMPRLMKNNILLIKNNGLWGLINTSGEYILPIVAHNIEWYDEMLSLKVKDKIVLFDAHNGELVDQRNLYEIQ